MGKFYGPVGYAETQETKPGRWTEVITERNYSGDILRLSNRWQSGEHLHDDLTTNNEISIVADPFAYQHFHTMKYVTWMGVNWKITNVEVQRPRLILRLGGVYNV